ncbi:MAG: bifunctional indole-3-glycerol-phosphate synthase TrpC/phosphoribosylanthranilate isomerase TrpF [Kangiellaceae bacterium]|nr:bifunctional indole-3-glycerol-phosphate synthase TrpC/phosphoribosylanthranilate isomerase TrpF [Kangiellaceae bacterium]
MLNVLQTIVEHKRQLIVNTADVYELKPSERDFKKALSHKQFAFIMECKKASPSKGLINKNFDLTKILPVYEQYADAISVLTEERFFQGSFNNLRYVSEHTDRPVLCKDFILEPKQVRLARYYGADAVLLMLSILNDFEYKACLQQAKDLNMDVLTEVHNEEELDRAIALGSEIIGINNRNLKDLTTSLENTKKLASRIPDDRIVVTESGIDNHDDVIELAAHADSCLVGSSLMASQDLESAVQKLVYGDIKICGLTNLQDRELVDLKPASTLGVIFAESSKRKLKQPIGRSQKPLIGVFQNQSVDFVSNAIKEYELNGIQLHGEESQNYINQLRASIGEEFFISKVIHALNEALNFNYQRINEFLIDSQVEQQQGGTGSTFDWNLLATNDVQLHKNKLRIAGGLNASNIQLLKQMGFSKLDICSGSEKSVGVKCSEKLDQIFDSAKLIARY